MSSIEKVSIAYFHIASIHPLADDILEGGKKSATRKWRQFKVALTGSQLLFFKDLRWDHQLSEKSGGGRVLTLPHSSMVKPDEVLSVNDAVAVLDTSYTKVCLEYDWNNKPNEISVS